MEARDMGYHSPQPGPDDRTTDAPRIYDPEVLKAVCGDNPDVIAQLLRRFEQVLDRDLRELESAIVRRSAVDVRHQAHQMVGTARSVGASEVAAAVERLGVSIRAKDWDQLRTKFRDLNAAVDRLKSRLYFSR